MYQKGDKRPYGQGKRKASQKGEKRHQGKLMVFAKDYIPNTFNRHTTTFLGSWHFDGERYKTESSGIDLINKLVKGANWWYANIYKDGKYLGRIYHPHFQRK